MKTTSRIMYALLWKELHELRWFWYAGMSVMVALPLIGELYFMFDFPGNAQVLVNVTLSLGAAFAVFTAVAATCRDLNDGMETFWRSRPISVTAFASVKFASGLLVVLSVAFAAIACQHLLTLAITFPGAGQGPLGYPTEMVVYAVNTLAVQGAVMTAMYAVAFALGAATARAVPAVFLSLLAGLMIYFVPVLLPPLAPLDVFEALHQPDSQPRLTPHLAAIMGTLLTVAMLAGIAAVAALHRQVRVDVDVKMLGWTLAMLLLLMMGVAAMQIGSDLTPTQVIAMTDERDEAAYMVKSGERYGVAVTSSDLVRQLDRLKQELHSGDSMWWHPWRHRAYRLDPTFHLFDLAREPATVQSMDAGFMFARHPVLIWSDETPELVTVGRVRQPIGLATYDLSRSSGDPLVRHVDWQELLDVTVEERRPIVPHAVVQDDGHLFIFFTASPQRDRENRNVLYAREFEIGPAHELTFRREHQWRPRRQVHRAGRLLSVDDILPPGGTFQVLHAPGWSLERQLRLSLVGHTWSDPQVWMLDDRHLVRYSQRHGVEVLQVAPHREREHDPDATGLSTLNYQRIGHRPPTPLERMASGGPTDVLVHEGLLYVLTLGPQSSMIVFDLRNPKQPRKLGHYAPPNDTLIRLTPTPDGRIIATGRDLHVFDPTQW